MQRDDLMVAVGAVRATLRREWTIIATMRRSEKSGLIKAPRPEYWNAKEKVLVRLNAELDKLEAEHVVEMTMHVVYHDISKGSSYSAPNAPEGVCLQAGEDLKVGDQVRQAKDGKVYRMETADGA